MVEDVAPNHVDMAGLGEDSLPLGLRACLVT